MKNLLKELSLIFLLFALILVGVISSSEEIIGNKNFEYDFIKIFDDDNEALAYAKENNIEILAR